MKTMSVISVILSSANLVWMFTGLWSLRAKRIWKIIVACCVLAITLGVISLTACDVNGPSEPQRIQELDRDQMIRELSREAAKPDKP